MNSSLSFVERIHRVHASLAEAAARVQYREFLGVMLPCLTCGDLAVFKAFFDRGKDWVDIAAMVSIDSFDIEAAMTQIERLLGADDYRIAKFDGLRDSG